MKGIEIHFRICQKKVFATQQFLFLFFKLVHIISVAYHSSVLASCLFPYIKYLQIIPIDLKYSTTEQFKRGFKRIYTDASQYTDSETTLFPCKEIIKCFQVMTKIWFPSVSQMWHISYITNFPSLSCGLQWGRLVFEPENAFAKLNCLKLVTVLILPLLKWN